MLEFRHADRDPRDDRFWSVPLLVLATATAIFGVPLLLRIRLNLQIDYNEGWNAFRQQAASVWQPLYGASPDMAVTNYPPLSFHLLGLTGRLGGGVVLMGRCASILAIVLIGLVAVLIGYRQSASRAVAACCGLGWIAGIEFWTPTRIGANDPQLLAMAFQSASLLAFLSCSGKTVRTASSAVLVTLAMFSKHNLLALPCGLTVHLLLKRDWWALAAWSLTGLVTGAVLLTASILLDGRFFLTHLLAPRLFLFHQVLAMPTLYATLSAPALVTIGIWIRRGGTERVSSPLVLIWIASLIEIIAFSGGDGVANNIFQDAILLTSMLLPPALQAAVRRYAHRNDRTRAVLALVPILVLPLLLSIMAPANWRAWQQAKQQQPELRRAVAFLGSQPGPVACEALLLCFQAGKLSAFDTYYVLDQIRLSRLPSQRIDDLIARQQLAAVEVGAPDDPETGDPADQPRRLSNSFMRALWAQYRPVMTTGGMTIFVPIIRQGVPGNR